MARRPVRPMPTLQERAALTEGAVTLDGRPARVFGYRLPFAVVRDREGRQGEWAWQTVAEVVAKGGAFAL